MPFEGAQRAADLVAVLLREPVGTENVAAVLLDHGEMEPLGLGDADVAAMRKVAPELHAVFAATSVEQAAGLLNDLLARYAHPPRLTTHGGEHEWHVHVDSRDDAPWAEWLVTSSAHALALLLAQRQRQPGGLCASAACGRPFADLGGGSPRRYCSERCATRERVAAHRRKG
ncbi:CGNR zinc finger domain-containing protein [Prauserella endophytica]|uniref:CGNR zinc finger domain-containing protein n=1 Tax=Prauserella endophytica TaxID=1592324 RepID=A0ABY2S1J5_9PSEU|nr:CGNR zinc finger domain-containing protein [Prauserella endophytica]TKG69111.1 CGNR zinc finger domain-containing protein [Prauserella endophytica]